MEDFDLDTFVGRFKHAKQTREQELGSPLEDKEIAAGAGCSGAAISQWMAEKVNVANLRATYVFGAAWYLKVRPEWLWAKKGPMRDGSEVQPDQESLPEHWDRLDAFQREMVESFIGWVLERAPALPEGKKASDKKRFTTGA